MNESGMVMSAITIIACLILVVRSSAFRGLSTRKALSLGAIWAGIIAVLVLIIHLLD